MRVSLSLIMVLLCFANLSSAVVINEVELNPPGDDQLMKAMYSEFVELYNDGMDNVDLSGWMVKTFPENMTIKIYPPEPLIPGGYYVIAQGGGWLSDVNETVILYDPQGNEVDRTPILNDTEDSEYSWKRIPDGYDTDNETDWKFALYSLGF